MPVCENNIKYSLSIHPNKQSAIDMFFKLTNKLISLTFVFLV